MKSALQQWGARERRGGEEVKAWSQKCKEQKQGKIEKGFHKKGGERKEGRAPWKKPRPECLPSGEDGEGDIVIYITVKYNIN